MVFFSKIVRKSGSGTPLPSPPSLYKKNQKINEEFVWHAPVSVVSSLQGLLIALIFYYVSSLGEKRNVNNFLRSIYCSEQNY